MQVRYYNYGTTANAEGLKAVHSSILSPQLLFGGELAVYSTDTISIAPCGLVFGDGVVMTESEIKYHTFALGGAAASWTVSYQHIDAAVSSGVPAELTVETGLLSSTSVRTVIGWVIYPGGSVPLSSEMLFRAPYGRSPEGHVVYNTIATPNDWLRTSASSDNGADTVPEPWTPITIPTRPTTASVSATSLLSTSYARSGIVIRLADGTMLTQVESITDLDNAKDQFHLNYNTRALTFSTKNAGLMAYGVDLTHGALCWRITNTAPPSKPGGDGSLPSYYDGFATSFIAQDSPPQQLAVTTVRWSGNAPLVSIVGVLDTELQPAVIDTDVLAPIVDGTVTTTRARILSGTFTPGKVWTAMWRIGCPEQGGYLLKTVSASSTARPF